MLTCVARYDARASWPGVPSSVIYSTRSTEANAHAAVDISYPVSDIIWNLAACAVV